MTLLEALFANRRLRGALNKQRGLLTNIPGFKLCSESQTTQQFLSTKYTTRNQ